MARRFMLLLFSILLLLFVLPIAGCGGPLPDESMAATRVCLFVTGALDDKSFFESAHMGLKKLETAMPGEVETFIVDGGEESQYGDTLRAASEEGYDIIIAMGYVIADHVQSLAPQYPDTVYILLDSSVDFSKGDCANVYCVEYKANEAGYLAGALCTSLVLDQGGAPHIGFVGAVNAPVINDFLAGYLAGAQAIDDAVKVEIDYVGDFLNEEAAYNYGKKQYTNGAGIIFSVASAAGMGVIRAAAETGGLVIGVDSDQAMVLEADHPEQSEVIVTSALKNTGDSLYNAVRQYKKGKLPLGQTDFHGLAEGAVMLANNKYSQAMISAQTASLLRDLERKIISGEIQVEGAQGLSF